jgi:uracil-DNA glycosylase
MYVYVINPDIIGVQSPPSLNNIFQEAQKDVNIAKPKHGNLEHWASQGVLLLNTALTVRKGESNSHQKKG